LKIKNKIAPPRFSLKTVFPVIFLILALIQGAAIFWLNQQGLDRNIEEEWRVDVEVLLGRLQGTIEYLYRVNDPFQTQEEITSIGADANIHFASFVDDQDNIAGDIRISNINLSFMKVLEREYPNQIIELKTRTPNVRNNLHSNVWLSKDRNTLFGLYPVVLVDNPNSVRQDKVGLLFIAYDLTSLKANTFSTLVWKSLPVMLVLFGVALLLGLLLYVLVTKRVDKVIASTQRFSAGDINARIEVKGRDELDMVATAFNNLAENVVHAQTEILEKGKQIQLLLDSTAEAVYGINLKGECTFANQACMEMLGYENITELHGQDMHSLMHHSYADGRAYPVDQSPINSAYEKEFGIHVDDEVLWRKDGSSFAAEYWSHPIVKSDKVVGAVVTFIDISERRKVEAQLEGYRDHLEELVEDRTRDYLIMRDEALLASQSKSDFLANMSHELRTPLNSIIGFTDIIRDGRVGDVNDEQARQLGMVSHSAQHLLSLINDILDLSKVEAGKAEIDLDDIEVASMLEDLEKMVRTQANEKGLEFKLEYSMNGAHTICSDRIKLRQVLINLLGNAVKFTNKGSITLRAKTSNELVTFEVEDTGIGINKDWLGDIFSSFKQVDESSGREYGGAGLGLAICREFVNVLGGEIEVESKPNVGSVFRVRFPVALSIEGREPINSELARSSLH